MASLNSVLYALYVLYHVQYMYNHVISEGDESFLILRKVADSVMTSTTFPDAIAALMPWNYTYVIGFQQVYAVYMLRSTLLALFYPRATRAAIGTCCTLVGSVGEAFRSVLWLF